MLQFKGIVSELVEYRQGSSKKEVEKMLNSEIISKDFSIRDFDEIELECNASVTIRKAEDFDILVRAPEKIVNTASLQVKKEGHTLQIKCPPLSPESMMGKINIEIRMPQLLELEVNNYARVNLLDFMADNMEIQISGNSELVANNNTIESLDMNCFGSSEVDFKDNKITNAKIQAFGSNEIGITMAGGTLEGSLTGSGELIYFGEVADVDVKTMGSTEVIRK